MTSTVVSAIRDGSAPLRGEAEAEGKARLAYIRGDRANEGGGRHYRQRNKATVLGDIVNSNPTYVGAEDFGYAVSNQVPGHGSYASYVENKTGRTPMIYVSANDGMLHGFNARSGIEELAYVPQSVFPTLSRLTRAGYDSRHRYLVDGSTSAVDAYSGSWGTYLIGTTGAGGKAVFALDVTPGNSAGRQDVLWEFSTAQLSEQGVDITLNTPAVGTLGLQHSRAGRCTAAQRSLGGNRGQRL